MKIQQPLIPQGSFSETLIISTAILCNKSAGNKTSVHAKWRLFAARNSSCKRNESAFADASSAFCANDDDVPAANIDV